MRKFTLIELLVVVAIIGILASLLLPSLQKARIKSMKTVCMSQSSQLGKFMALSAVETDKIFCYPDRSNGNWLWDICISATDNYEIPREVMYCPLKSTELADFKYFFNPDFRVTDYFMTQVRWDGMITGLNPQNPNTPESGIPFIKNLSALEKPDKTAMNGDAVFEAPSYKKNNNDRLPSNHLGYGSVDINVTYADGHSKLIHQGKYQRQYRGFWW